MKDHVLYFFIISTFQFVELCKWKCWNQEEVSHISKYANNIYEFFYINRCS